MSKNGISKVLNVPIHLTFKMNSETEMVNTEDEHTTLSQLMREDLSMI
jgi:hypothetical protein